VVPIDAAWERADSRLALGFWPWSMLAQEAPLPERLLLGAAEAVLDGALGGWGTPPAVFDDGVRAAYLDQLRDPDHVRAICEEYRAAATIDPSHDAEDRAAGRRIPCPVRVLWSGEGPLGSWYAEDGGPLILWEGLCQRLEGEPVAGGHFFPEEHPAALAADIRDFLGRTPPLG
jgi:haloacetate dehalogenase